MSLKTDIYNQLKGAVSATTEHVFYNYLPSDEYLSELTVVYELSNTGNENTFDSKEAEKVYSLEVKLNNRNSNYFESVSIYIKQAVYGLKNINQSIGNISLQTETEFWDSELEIMTYIMIFEIKYH